MAKKRKTTSKTTSKTTTKKDLESKIAALEAKLSKLSADLQKPAEAPPKPAEAPPKPAEAPPKPAEAPPKPAEAPPKPAEAPPPPVTPEQALENARQNYPMTYLHDYRAKTSGYAPNPNRYYARQFAPAGKVQTSSWNIQKVATPAYTQPSNQYFATRARLAYHPANLSHKGLTFEGATAQAQTETAPPPPPKPDAALPKETAQQTTSASRGSSKQQELEAYEADYMARLANQEREQQELMKAAAELAAKRQAESQPSGSQSKKGSLPKGF